MNQLLVQYQEQKGHRKDEDGDYNQWIDLWIGVYCGV